MSRRRRSGRALPLRGRHLGESLKSGALHADSPSHHGVGPPGGATKGGATALGSEHPRRSVRPTSRFTISRAGGTVIVSIQGEIGAEEWSLVGAVLRDLIDAQGNLDVVLDLCELGRLETDAVPLIVHAARQAHTHGGRLRLADRACRDRWEVARP